jgi:type IV secretory pathway TrbD component
VSDLRVVPENRALARRPHLLGLPSGYAALLVMAVLFLALSLKYVGAGLYVLAVGWGFGRLVTYYDPFAFEIVARNLRVPRRLRA